MFHRWTFPLLALTVSLFALAGLSAAATLNVITDDTPAAILYSNAQGNPIVHLSAVDHTITATTTPLCPYEVHLDGQWEGSVVASDGKVYFGTSSHAPHTSGLVMQYDPGTGLVHKLGSLNAIVNEDPNYYRPQGKLHSAITESSGYLYFSTYYGYEGNNSGGYPGGHMVRYKLGSYEANPAAPVFKDMGIPYPGGTIYTATTVDTVNNLVWVNSNGVMYNYNGNLPDSTTFSPVTRGALGGEYATCFHHFVDSQYNLWTTSQEIPGNVWKFPFSGSASTYSAVLPPVRRPDNLAIDSGYQFGCWFDWGDKLDNDHFVFNMEYDTFLWILDANQARQGHFALGQAFKKVANIGVGGLDTCLAGHTVYWLSSARGWNSYCSFNGPNNPDTNYYNYTSDCKAKDLHLLSIDLNDPRLSAPGYDPNVTDANLVTDWGRIVDQNGRTPYRCEGMSSDGLRVYLTGDWRNLPTDPNNWHTLKALYLDIDGGYQQIWRGQFFGVIQVASNLAPIVNAGSNQSINLPNVATLAGTVSDDGKPNPPGACTIAWSQVSGPSSVIFASPSVQNTTATFSAVGTYVLQLAASDSVLNSTSTVQIIVNPQPVNQAPVVNAGANQTVTQPATTASLAGAVSDDGLPVGAVVTSTWSVVSGPGSVTFANVNAPSTTATFSTLGTYVLRLTASDTALSNSATTQVVVQAQGSLVMALHLPFDEGSGTVAADTSGNGRNGTLAGGTTWITGKLGHAVQFDGVSGQVTVPDFALSQQFSVAFWFKASNLPNMYSYMFSWGTVSNVNSINIWFYVNPTPTIRTDIQDSVGADPTNFCDIIDANMTNGQWHHYCATVANSGGLTVYIDGQPRVTYAPVGGHTITPATNLFIGGRCDNNTARYYAGGVDDVRIYSQALAAADVQSLYNGPPANVAPTATASAGYPKVMIPNGLSLMGTISDDGQPNPPGVCTAAWSKVSGPGTVTFANPAAASTTATFSTAGTYVLQLTASDSVLTGTSNVTVTALAPGDFNGDGKVDGVDFLIWQSHYPTSSGGTPDGGDANGDGKVDGVDFLVWQSNYH